MSFIRYIGILVFACVLTGCSYFDTGETIEVTSEGMEEQPVVEESRAVEDLIYNRSEGSVEIYNLDGAAERYSNSEDVRRNSGVTMNPNVEIYPIDLGMQKTLQPGS